MRLARVLGQVVATVKDPTLEGLRLMVVQALDEKTKPLGKPFVAVDAIRCAGPNDVVYIVQKRDAAIALTGREPVDAAIVGFVDQVALEGTPESQEVVWNPNS